MSKAQELRDRLSTDAVALVGQIGPGFAIAYLEGVVDGLHKAMPTLNRIYQLTQEIEEINETQSSDDD